jgi:DNA-binding winged helix-turn-helix (wHTH) protein
VASEPLKAQHRVNLSEGVEFDPSSDELYRSGRVLKLERIPAALLLLLVERRGQVVNRDEIVERVWGKDVFLDTDNVSTARSGKSGWL